MLAEMSFQFDWARWKDWAPVAVGVAFGLIVFVWIWFTLGRRQARPPEQPAEDHRPKDPFLFGSSQERRAAARRRGNPVAVWITDVTGKAPPSRSLVLDRSVGGLCLEMSRPVVVGTILNVRPAETAEILPWVAVEVRYCVQVEDSWHTGCQFLRTPPSNVLWQFG